MRYLPGKPGFPFSIGTCPRWVRMDGTVSDALNWAVPTRVSAWVRFGHVVPLLSVLLALSNSLVIVTLSALVLSVSVVKASCATKSQA